MTEIRINNPIERGFAMVPDVLWQWPGLSFRAKGFMAFLLSFRGGLIPPVAAIEAATGLGRDARKAVMRELQAARLAEWKVQHDARGRVVAKFLLVDTSPLLRAVADGVLPVVPRRAPEKPSDGKSVDDRRKTRRIATENPGDIVERETERAAPASKAGARPLSVAQVEKHAREGEAARPAESGQGAENEKGEGDVLARKLAKARVSASLGQVTLCPVSGRWLPASVWLSNDARGQYAGGAA